jgi:hypothetical protein
MPPNQLSLTLLCAAALTQAALGAVSSYFPRFWSQNSPATITIVGSGFSSASAYSGLSFGASSCASTSVVSDAQVVCTTSQTSGTLLAATFSGGNIPPRAMVDLSSQLGIQTPPFGDSWKLSFLPATSDIVLNLNCRMKDGKVIRNSNSESLECSSIDVNDWALGSGAYKFLYTNLPNLLSLGDPELVLRVSADALRAKLTIRFLTAPGSTSSSDGAAAAKSLQQMFASGRFHSSFGRIFNSMCCPPTPSFTLYRVFFLLKLVAHVLRAPHLPRREYNGATTDLKLSGLDETLPGLHIFLIYLGCLGAVFLSWTGATWIKRRNKDPKQKEEKQKKKADMAKEKEDERVADAAPHAHSV